MDGGVDQRSPATLFSTSIRMISTTLRVPLICFCFPSLYDVWVFHCRSLWSSSVGLFGWFVRFDLMYTPHMALVSRFNYLKRSKIVVVCNSRVQMNREITGIFPGAMRLSVGVRIQNK